MTDRLPNGYHIGDIVRIRPLENQECEVVAEPHHGRDNEHEVWHENPHFGPTYANVRGVTLVSCPHVEAEPPLLPTLGRTSFHIGDKIRIRGENRGGTIRGEHFNSSGDSNGLYLEEFPNENDWWYPTRFELEECPHMNVPAPTDRDLPSHYIPWGPDHPDWAPFWEKADKLAVASRVCTEYDRFVQHMGGPERSTTITVAFTVPRSMADRPVSELVTLRSGASDLRTLTAN